VREMIGERLGASRNVAVAVDVVGIDCRWSRFNSKEGYVHREMIPTVSIPATTKTV
jgi:hypothetical protein